MILTVNKFFKVFIILNWLCIFQENQNISKIKKKIQKTNLSIWHYPLCVFVSPKNKKNKKFEENNWFP